MDVYEMSRDQFREALANKTTPQFVYDNAGTVYETLTAIFEQNCMDSVLREWAFEWASDGTARPYDDIYNRWLAAE